MAADPFLSEKRAFLTGMNLAFDIVKRAEWRAEVVKQVVTEEFIDTLWAKYLTGVYAPEEPKDPKDE